MKSVDQNQGEYECSLTGEIFDRSIIKQYLSSDLNGQKVDHELRGLHNALVAITEIHGKVPLSLHQRYGTDIMRTFQRASMNLREAIMRACNCHIEQEQTLEKAA